MLARVGQILCRFDPNWPLLAKGWSEIAKFNQNMHLSTQAGHLGSSLGKSWSSLAKSIKGRIWAECRLPEQLFEVCRAPSRHLLRKSGARQNGKGQLFGTHGEHFFGNIPSLCEETAFTRVVARSRRFNGFVRVTVFRPVCRLWHVNCVCVCV